MRIICCEVCCICTCQNSTHIIRHTIEFELRRCSASFNCYYFCRRCFFGCFFFCNCYFINCSSGFFFKVCFCPSYRHCMIFGFDTINCHRNIELNNYFVVQRITFQICFTECSSFWNCYTVLEQIGFHRSQLFCISNIFIYNDCRDSIFIQICICCFRINDTLNEDFRRYRIHMYCNTLHISDIIYSLFYF